MPSRLLEGEEVCLGQDDDPWQEQEQDDWPQQGSHPFSDMSTPEVSYLPRYLRKCGCEPSEICLVLHFSRPLRTT